MTSGSATPGTFLIGPPRFLNQTAVGRYSCNGRVVIPPMLSDRVREPAESNHPVRYLRSESEPQFTPRMYIVQPPGGHSYHIHAGSSDLLELGVALDKLF